VWSLPIAGIRIDSGPTLVWRCGTTVMSTTSKAFGAFSGEQISDADPSRSAECRHGTSPLVVDRALRTVRQAHVGEGRRSDPFQH
jgi:hypothetical protein